MLARSLLLVTTFLLLPLAAAGPGAHVSTLDGEADCAAAGGRDTYETSTNDTWSTWSRAWGWSSCEDAFEYAGASVWGDRGEVVSARARADHENESSFQETRSFDATPDAVGYDSSSTDAQRDAWSRSVEASSAAGDVGAAYGCRSTSQGWAMDHWVNSPAGGHRNDATSFVSDDRCGIDADAGDERAFVGSSCRATGSSSSSSQWSSSGDGHHQGWGSSDDDCFTGASSDAGAVGHQRACAASWTDAYAWSGDENGTSSSWHAARRTCVWGIGASGPDGASAFVGMHATDHSFCANDQCHTDGSRAVGAEFRGEHNPVGPFPVGGSVTLP